MSQKHSSYVPPRGVTATSAEADGARKLGAVTMTPHNAQGFSFRIKYELVKANYFCKYQRLNVLPG